MVVLYSRDHEGLPKIIDQKSDSQYFHDALTVLVEHNQTQK